MNDKDWHKKYEDLLLDMEILSDKALRLVSNARSIAHSHDFDWNLSEEVEFIAQKYEL